MNAKKIIPSVTLEPNESLLDRFHEELIASANTENKVSINELQSPSFYLPALNNVLELLGFPSKLNQLVDFLEKKFGIPLTISRTSKYDFFGKGVGLRTLKKFVIWCKLLPLPIAVIANKKIMTKAIRHTQLGSNGGHWLSSIHSFDSGFKSARATETDKHEFVLLFNFIEQRCSTERDLFKNIQQKVNSGELSRNNLEQAWNAQQSLWANNPNIPTDVYKRFGQLLVEWHKSKTLDEQQGLEVFEGYCYLFFDFYMEAITHYEIGCRFYYGQNLKDQEKIENELGSITKAINDYAVDNTKSCFGGMLKQLKELLTETVGETSFRTMASFIDIEVDSSKELTETLADKQYNQLKDWRNGNNPPSNKKLTVFLDNLDKYASKDSGDLTFLMCKIAMGIDKLVDELVANKSIEHHCKPKDAVIIIKKILANMPNYYFTNLKTELEKKSQ